MTARTTPRNWTAAQVLALGVRTDVPTAGEIIGFCPDSAYRAVKRGTFPVPVIKVGHRLVVPTAPILELLGISPDMSVAAPSTDAATTIETDSPSKEIDRGHHNERRR